MAADTVGRPMEILLVEDSLVAARLAIGVLKQGQFQHRLTWLTDGNEAVEFLQRGGKFARAPRPDLILLDLGLPGRDGREVLVDIKSDDTLLRIPVVVLTASTDEADQVESERLHVEGYMVKPFDIERFLELVRELNRFWHADMILPASS